MEIVTAPNAAAPPRRRVALRPLALPSEHGGWGILLEPATVGLLVAFSWTGALLGVAALGAFLGSHPLRLALQDAERGKRYPRTPYCWALAWAYLFVAGCALVFAARAGGPRILIPLGLVAPLAMVRVLYDAHNRGRELLPELSGAAAMSSLAAAIAIAGGMRIVPALGLAGIVLGRSLPSIVYVRGLLRGAPAWPALLLHGVAAGVVAIYGPPLAIAAMVLLLLRAIWGVTHERPAARMVGWREIVFGAITVALVAAAFLA